MTISEVHLDLVHFSVSNLPIAVVGPMPLPEDGEEAFKCHADRIAPSNSDIEALAIAECIEEPFCEIAIPAEDPETGEPLMGVFFLCRHHLALMFLRGDELTEKFSNE